MNMTVGKNMAKSLQVHYLEVVTPDVTKVCSSYTQTLGVSFSDPISELGNARTAALSNGGTIGVRAPMHEAEAPVTRTYYLVADIEKAVEEGRNTGAKIAVPVMDIRGRGKCAILMYGAIQSGFWQV